MKKIMISLFFIMVFVSFACASFNLNPTTDSFTVNQGDNINSKFVITNTGTDDIKFVFPAKFNLTGYDNEISVAFSPSSIIINGGASENISYNIDLPESVYAGMQTGQFSIVSNESNTTYDITVDISQVVNLSAPSELDFGEIFPNKTNSQPIIIKNIGNVNLSISEIKTTGDKYGLVLNPSSIDILKPGQETSITAEITVPLDTAPINDEDIGDFIVVSDKGTFNYFNFFKVDIGSYLYLDEISVEIDGEKDTIREDGEKIEDTAKPMQTIKMAVKVENLFDTKSSLEIEISNVEVEITIFGIDDSEDIELVSEDITLDYDGNERKHTFELEFEVPIKAEDGNYDIQIILTGTDDEDVDYEIIWDSELKVDRDSHDLILYGYELLPNDVCSGSEMIINLEIINLGDNDEDYVRYTIKNSDLGIDKTKSRFEILSDFEDDDNVYSESIPITIRNVEKGTYPIEMRVYRDFDVIEDVLTRNLEVSDCGEEKIIAEPEEEPEEEIIEEPEEEPEEEPVVQEPVTKKEEEKSFIEKILPKVEIAESPLVMGTKVINRFKQFRESDNYLITLLFILLVIMALIGLIIKLHKRK